MAALTAMITHTVPVIMPPKDTLCWYIAPPVCLKTLGTASRSSEFQIVDSKLKIVNFRR